jgi:alpha(1,3/1,4) fucosyltransferase
LNRSVFALISFFSLLSLFSAERVEIYEDWQPHATGNGVDRSIAAAFDEKGYSTRRWDRVAHEPFLLTWKKVKTWADFKHWLGFGLPRKAPLEEGTAYLIFHNLGVHLKDLNLGKLPKEKLILFTWEPPTVQPEIWDPKIQKWFHKIYTWNDDLVDNVRYFKFYYPVYSLRSSDLVPYEERKFLTLIASRLSSKHPRELYSERERLIRFFETRPEVEFDLYGRYWEKRKFRSWKGAIPDKLSVLKKYRFACAYENSTESGYITEKIWDCFAAGVVPVYWGAPNVESYIPPDCFIDRRKFESNEALLAFLQRMTKEEWERYLERAELFLQSEAAKKFSSGNYIRILADAVSF